MKNFILLFLAFRASSSRRRPHPVCELICSFYHVFLYQKKILIMFFLSFHLSFFFLLIFGTKHFDQRRTCFGLQNKIVKFRYKKIVAESFMSENKKEISFRPNTKEVLSLRCIGF